MAEPVPSMSQLHNVTLYDRMRFAKGERPGKSSSMTFSDIETYSRNPKVYPEQHNDGTVTKLNKPNDLGMIGFFHAPNGGTETDDVESASLLCIDYDKGTTSIEEALRLWGAHAPCVLYTTWNHAPACPRFRIVLELSRSVSPDDYALLYRAIKARAKSAKHLIDESCANVSRRWFIPSHREDQEYISRSVTIASPLDVDRMLADIVQADAQHVQRVTMYSEQSRPQNTKEKRGIAWVELSACMTIKSAPEGTRDSVLTRYTRTVGGLVANGWILRSTAHAMLLSAILSNNGDPVSDSAKIDRMLDAGAKYPIDLPERDNVRQLRPIKQFPAERNVDVLANALRATTTQKEGQTFQEPITVYHDEERTWYDLLTKGDSGTLESTTANLLVLLANMGEFRGVFSFNRRSGAAILSRALPTIAGVQSPSTSYPRNLTDDDFTSVKAFFEASEMALRFGVDTIASAIGFTARSHSFDPVEDYLNRLSWDGVPRLDTWLYTACGVISTPYAMSVGRKWLISGVARGLKPGCKVDTMLVLEGGQGTRKSTLLSALMPDETLFVDHLPELDQHIQVVEQIRGPWLVEVAELDAFGKADETKIKQFLSTQKDRYTAKYKRTAEEVPRSVFFAGTTNKHEWIKDSTGGRRFWPISIDDNAKLDVDWVRANRDQLWAEAVNAFKLNEAWWLSDTEEDHAKIEQSSRIASDPWQSMVAKYAEGRESVSVESVLADVCEIKVSQLSHNDRRRVTSILGALGYRSEQVRIDGKRVYRWIKKTPF
jgi:predicted P-loop ATPase